MRVIGIDPGYDRLGVAVVEQTTGPEEYCYSCCVQTSSADQLSDRLLHIGTQMREIISQYTPDAIAIETLYVTKNQKTAMGVAQARGIIMYEAAQAGLAIYEYTPQQIKVAVTGHGGATKQQIMDMVPKLISLPNTITLDDEMDAVAVAITALAHIR